ncbi:MAG: sialate O-acetylesterase, partial [Sphingobacteriales bacterium]
PAAPANAAPQTLSAAVNGQVPVKLTNLLIGDVWICSGQSNMEMTVDSTSAGLFYSGITNYKAEIAAANFPQIREVNVKVDRQNNKKDTLLYPLKWTVCSPATVGPYSAVAYFFARTVHLGTKVPVGIVVSCFGGSYAEQWTSKETIQNDPVLAGYYKSSSNSSLYNGMINPLRNLSIKGFAWYQGESNRDDKPLTNYVRLMRAMIGNWRTLFNQGQLPFYYTQVAPYARDFFSTNPWGGNPVLNDLAYFREAQSAIKSVTPNTGQAITMDVGDALRIHPYNKRPIGERLGLLALQNTYGLSVQSLGPQYLSWTNNSNKATISFVAGTAKGLNTINNTALKQYFFVAGTDHVFRQATAVISGEQMVVTAPGNTPLPIQAVRYAFTNFPNTNLQNSSGLPMEAFRTDDWTN